LQARIDVRATLGVARLRLAAAPYCPDGGRIDPQRGRVTAIAASSCRRREQGHPQHRSLRLP